MPSFDIVSKTDMEEINNAVNGASKEIETRFDFKGSKCSFDLKQKDEEIIILADDSLKLKQMHELLKTYLTRRKLDISCLDFGKEEQATGNSIRQSVKIKQGLTQEVAKKIIKSIKDSKMKVQCSIQKDEVRVSGKKRDDLQETIAFVKGLETDRPLQYVNFRD